MKKAYDKNKNNDNYKINDKVLYYIGDRNSHSRKLRHRWTGPFTISQRINENTVEITTAKPNEKLEVHTSRLKKWNTRDNDYWKLDEYEQLVANNAIKDEITDDDDKNEEIENNDDFDDIMDNNNNDFN